jgi:8-amino-7-oxononanoate synthase
MSDEELPGAWRSWASDLRDDLAERTLLRELRALEVIDALHARRDGRELVLFSTNDYLGLSDHPQVRDAIAAAAARAGSGPRGSALICGYTDAHRALEEQIASLKGRARALVFPTGYAANLATITALSDGDTAIFSDALNHASIIDATRLARRRGASVEVYPHNDTDELDARLTACDRPRKMIVTDSVFSMDGDLAPLEALVELKRRHDALLAIDEAHGTLVFGPGGGGVASARGVAASVDLHIGTLSKAAGGQGGFVACEELLWQTIFNRGRSYIYSTALPTTTVAGLRAALALGAGPEGDALRAKLREHVRRFGRALGRELTSPIVAVVVGDESRALELDAELFARGFHVVAIRPPTVPPGTARLRITLSAGHTDAEVDALLEALAQLDALE